MSVNSIVSGPDRSAFSPNEGQLYIPTSKGEQLAIGTGATWSNLGQLVDPVDGDYLTTSGGTLTGNLSIEAGFDSHTIRAKEDPVVNVKHPDFGAVGDGVADDTAAIQAAVNYIVNTPGTGLLAFEAGDRYRITSPITVDVESVRGIEGNNGTLLIDGSFAALDITGTHTGTSIPDNVTEHTEMNETGAYVGGVRFRSTDLTNPTGTAIRFTQTMSFSIRNCDISSVEHGIHIVGNNRNGVFTDNWIYDCAGYGIWQERGDYHQVNITGNHISYCRKCIYIEDPQVCHDWQIVANDIETGNAPTDATHAIHAEHTGAVASTELAGMKILGQTFDDHSGGLTDALIQMDGFADEWRQIHVSHNKVTNTPTGVPFFKGTGGLRKFEIASNNARHVRGTFIDLAGLWYFGDISNNICESENTAGFLNWDMGGLYTGGTTIHGNNHWTQRSGFYEPSVYFTNGDLTTVRFTDNFFRSNVTGHTNPYWLVEFDVGNLSDCHIRGNALRTQESSADGMRVAPSGTVRNSFITENGVYGVSGLDDAYDIPTGDGNTLVTRDNLYA